MQKEWLRLTVDTDDDYWISAWDKDFEGNTGGYENIYALLKYSEFPCYEDNMWESSDEHLAIVPYELVE